MRIQLFQLGQLPFQNYKNVKQCCYSQYYFRKFIICDNMDKPWGYYIR